jgi:hypothetical protein
MGPRCKLGDWATITVAVSFASACNAILGIDAPNPVPPAFVDAGGEASVGEDVAPDRSRSGPEGIFEGDADIRDAVHDMADGGSWCATQSNTTFCSDFDTFINVEAGFTSVSKRSGGTIERSTTFSSSPASARLAVPANALFAEAFLEFSQATTATRVELEFDLQLSPVAIGDAAAAQLRVLQVAQKSPNTNGESHVDLYMHPDGWHLAVIQPSQFGSDYALANMPSFSTFTHVRFDIGWADGTGTVSLEAGGAPIEFRDGLVTGVVAPAPTPVAVRLGFHAPNNISPAGECLVDNVAIRLLP